jgi:hypothetical protein
LDKDDKNWGAGECKKILGMMPRISKRVELNVTMLRKLAPKEIHHTTKRI